MEGPVSLAIKRGEGGGKGRAIKEQKNFFWNFFVYFVAKNAFSGVLFECQKMSKF